MSQFTKSGRGPRRSPEQADPHSASLSPASGTALRLVPPRPEPLSERIAPAAPGLQSVAGVRSESGHDYFKEMVDDILGT